MWELFGIVAMYTCLVVLGIFLLRWILGIDKIVHHQRLQTRMARVQVQLLARLCERSGATPEEVQAILRDGNLPDKAGEKEHHHRSVY